MMAVDRSCQPEIREPENIEISRPERHTLHNGTPLYVIRAGEQDVVRMDILIEAGTWKQTQKLQALFTHRMLREGSLKYSSSDIAEKLDYYGAWLELSNSHKNAYLTLYSLNKYFSEVLCLIESIIKEPVFPERELNTIIETNIQQFLVNSSKVDFVAHRAMMATMFGEENPCGQFADEDDYHKVAPQVLRSFYEQHYHTGNFSIYLSGKVTDQIIHQVEKSFGTEFLGIPSPFETNYTYPTCTAPQKRIWVERKSALQSSVKLSGFTIGRSHPDYLKLRVLITLFGGYFGSRLMSNIREEKGYTYGISIGIVQYPQTAMMVISTETATEYVEPLIQEIYNEIDKIHNEPISKEELSLVKNYMLGETCRSYESPFSLADAWMFIHASELSDDYYEHVLEAIKTVTPDELTELSRRYICKENLKEIVAGKNIS